MTTPLPTILLPMGSAFLYALAAVYLKNAIRFGVGPWRVTFVANLAMALVACSMLPLGGNQPVDWTLFYQPVLAATCFFAGQILTFLALAKGDVSVATPMLGTKTIMVAFFGLFLFNHAVPIAWIAGAVLTAVAVALLGGGGFRWESGVWKTLLLAWASACSFALCDILVQEWAPIWGAGYFIPMVFGLTAFYSLGLIPFFREPLWRIPKPARIPFLLGSSLVAVQAIGIAIAISIYGHATAANIVYSSRGLWSVLLVWVLGRFLQNEEGRVGRKVMTRRLIGASLILAAIVLVILG